jgi:hypothetical protein
MVLAARSASRPLADLRDTGSRATAFDVSFPLVSGLNVPVLPRSANDPKPTDRDLGSAWQWALYSAVMLLQLANPICILLS